MLNILNFLFFALVEPNNGLIKGRNTEKTDLQKILQQTNVVLEWLLRITIYAASALQLLFLCSKYAKFCAMEKDQLALKYNFMLSLAIAQVVFTTVHIVWKFFIIKTERAES